MKLHIEQHKGKAMTREEALNKWHKLEELNNLNDMWSVAELINKIYDSMEDNVVARFEGVCENVFMDSPLDTNTVIESPKDKLYLCADDKRIKSGETYEVIIKKKKDK